MANEGQHEALDTIDELELVDEDDEVTQVSSADATGSRPALEERWTMPQHCRKSTKNAARSQCDALPAPALPSIFANPRVVYGRD